MLTEREPSKFAKKRGLIARETPAQTDQTIGDIVERKVDTLGSGTNSENAPNKMGNLTILGDIVERTVLPDDPAQFKERSCGIDAFPVAKRIARTHLVMFKF